MHHTHAEPKPLVVSDTPGAVQRNWKVPAQFPLCPAPSVANPIPTYFDGLFVGDIAVITPFGQTVISDAAMSNDRQEIFLLGDHGDEAIKRWSLMKITFEDGLFVHESRGTFFEQNGVEQEFTEAQGLVWEGGDSIENYLK